MLKDNDIELFFQAIESRENIFRLASFENWTVDEYSDVTRNLLSQIGEKLKIASKEKLDEISLSEWARFLSIISLPRSIVVVEKLEQTLPGFLIDLIGEAEDSEEVGMITLRNRMMILYRTNSLAYVFSEKRIKAIRQFMEFKEGKLC